MGDLRFVSAARPRQGVVKVSDTTDGTEKAVNFNWFYVNSKNALMRP